MDKLIKRYKVDFDVIDVSGKLSINVISRYMQELAAEHATKLGISFVAYGRKSEYYWILSRVKYDIQEYPIFNDKIIIETYPAGYDKLFLVRKFEIKKMTGELIGEITANYLIMDAVKKRPVKIEKCITSLSKLNCMYEGTKVGKVQKVINPIKQEVRKAYYSEIDYNGHMNNSQYIRWAVDMLTDKLINGINIKSLEINYNKSVMCNDEIKLSLEDVKDNKYLISGDSLDGVNNYFVVQIVLS